MLDGGRGRVDSDGRGGSPSAMTLGGRKGRRKVVRVDESMIVMGEGVHRDRNWTRARRAVRQWTNIRLHRRLRCRAKLHTREFITDFGEISASLPPTVRTTASLPCYPTLTKSWNTLINNLPHTPHLPRCQLAHRASSLHLALAQYIQDMFIKPLLPIMVPLDSSISNCYIGLLHY
jgi:hypothetical protein